MKKPSNPFTFFRLAFFLFLILLCGCSERYNPKQYSRDLDCEILFKKRVAAKHSRSFRGLKEKSSDRGQLAGKTRPRNKGYYPLEDTSSFLTSSFISHPALPFFKYNPQLNVSPLTLKEQSSVFSQPTRITELPVQIEQEVGLSTKSIVEPDAITTSGNFIDKVLVAVLIAGPALLSLLFLSLFADRAMQVSAWAAHHPTTTRGILAGLQTASIAGSYMVGNYFGHAGLTIPAVYSGMAFAGFTGAMLLYPKRVNTLANLRFRYLQQKFCDVTLFLTGATMMLHAGNHQFPVRPDTFANYYNPGINYEYKIQADVNMLQMSFSKTPESKQEDPAKRNGKVWMIILASLVYGILALSVAVLACVIACNGQGALAAIILIGGEVGLGFALASVLKSIKKNYKVKRSKKRMEMRGET